MTAAEKIRTGLDAGTGWGWETAAEPLDERLIAILLEQLEQELEHVLAAA